MISCSYHCSACGACFGGLAAFDAHRQFEEGHKGDWDRRICIEPRDDKRFAAKSWHGACRLARPPKADTPVWTLKASQEKWAERKYVSAETDSEAA